MKHLFITLLLTFGLFAKTFPDAGNCVKYEVAIELLDGQKIRGAVYSVGYETKFHFKDILFLDFERKNNPTDTLHVYRNITQLQFPTAYTNRNGGMCQFYFYATTDDNYLKISKKKIKKIDVLSYGVCHSCDLADEVNGYYWNGLSPSVITELTKTEIDLLQTKPACAINFWHDVEHTPYGYWMISYSTDYGLTDLERLKKNFLDPSDKLLRENKWNIVQANYEVFKEELRKKKIIIFKTTFTQ